MAKIFPFQPYRYSAAAGPLDRLVTQPYDKISPAMQRRYLSLSPYNLVRIILGERFPADNAENNVYTRAATYFENWIREGILARDGAPGLYAYFQRFQMPDSGETLERKGFIGLGAVEDYSAGVVYRHERTLSGPKKDRMELLKHTHAHFGQVFMLYPDPALAVDNELDASAADDPDAIVQDEFGAVHRVWKIAGPERLARIRQIMSDKKLLIADGHHRYETALAFRAAHPDLEDAAKVMMTFVNMHSPGLKILATHRVVRGLRDFDPAAFRSKLSAQPLASWEELKRIFAAPDPRKIRIGIALAGNSGLLLFERPRQPGELDVRALHDELLGKILGMSEEAVREERNLEYVRGIEAAQASLAQEGAQVAFLLEPATMEQVAGEAFSGGVMPQKSTDFFPKLLSGFTIYKLDK